MNIKNVCVMCLEPMDPHPSGYCPDCYNDPHINMFRILQDNEEVRNFRRYAHDNFRPGENPQTIWHPVIKREWEKLAQSSNVIVNVDIGIDIDGITAWVPGIKLTVNIPEGMGKMETTVAITVAVTAWCSEHGVQYESWEYS